MCSLGEHINDWGNNSEIYSLLVSALTLLATSVVGYLAYRIAFYQSRQNDRYIVEKIYADYALITREFIKASDGAILLASSEYIKKIWESKDLADLYGETEIMIFLDTILNKYLEVNTTQFKAYVQRSFLNNEHLVTFKLRLPRFR